MITPARAAVEPTLAAAGRHALADAIKHALRGMGGFDDEVTEAYASLVSHFYAATAGRLGMTADTLFRAMPFHVDGQPRVTDLLAEPLASDVGDPRTPGATTDDSRTPAAAAQALRALRRGTRPRRSSLTPFVAAAAVSGRPADVQLAAGHGLAGGVLAQLGTAAARRPAVDAHPVPWDSPDHRTFNALDEGIYRHPLPAGGGPRTILSQSAFHGSPYVGIERLSTAHVGTGEGAQVYGWGLYFTSQRAIAEHYRKSLGGLELVYTDPEAEREVRILTSFQDAPWRTLTELLLDDVMAGQSDAGAMARKVHAYTERWSGDRDTLRRLAGLIESGHVVPRAGGALYEVGIPEDDDMLLWDARLEDQPDRVKAQLAKLTEDALLRYRASLEAEHRAASTSPAVHSIDAVARQRIDHAIEGMREILTHKKGRGLYRGLAQIHESDRDASLVLAAAGVKGIKYLDGDSRPKGEGSYNYVVFRDEDVAVARPATPDTTVANTLHQAARPGPPSGPEPVPACLSRLADLIRGKSFAAAKRAIVAQVGSVRPREQFDDDVADAVFLRLQRVAQVGAVASEAELAYRGARRLTGEGTITLYRAAPKGAGVRPGDFAAGTRAEAGFYKHGGNIVQAQRVPRGDVLAVEGSSGGGQEFVHLPEGYTAPTAAVFFDTFKAFFDAVGSAEREGSGSHDDRSRNVLNQPAFHGSARQGIRQFSTQHIGTGEGVNAYGWGLYFAGKREVAEFYRRTLSPNDGADGAGQVYKVDVPEDEELLLWDRPLGEQSPQVRRSLEPFIERYIAQMRHLLSAFQPEEIEREIRANLKTIDGQGIYEQAGYIEGGGDRSASEYLMTLGIKGIKYLDGLSRAGDQGSYNFVIFSGDDVLVREHNEVFFQSTKPARESSAFGAWSSLYQPLRLAAMPESTAAHASLSLTDAPRGAIDLATRHIALFTGADRSTFLHEAGHLFLEMHFQVSEELQRSSRQRPGQRKPDLTEIGRAQILADTDILLKWFGVESLHAWRALSFAERAPHHERFARGMEAYLCEGRAPAPGLQGIFERFKIWLIDVYQDIRQLDVELTDEVRGVFDRMLVATLAKDDCDGPCTEAVEAEDDPTFHPRMRA